MATITLNLPSELEQQLRLEAEKQGLEPAGYILHTLIDRLQPQAPPTEAQLLQQINLGFSAETWEQYHTLIAKRRAENLTPVEHQQLIALSESLEHLNVKRISALIQLANLRSQPLPDLMQSLGIAPNPDLLNDG
jgi:hypothetical protein